MDDPGISKSDRTRAAILAAARDLFAARGYRMTTVRDIASRARVDAALVNRYFGGKDGLFAQATEVDLDLPDLGAVPRERIGEVLACHYLALWDDPGQGTVLTILLRTAASDAVAAERVQGIFASQVMPVLKGIVADEELGLRSGLISSQVLGLALGRYILKLPPLVVMDQERIVAALAPTFQRYALGDLRLPDEG